MTTIVPKISVCCCTFNRPDWLGELIHSYLIQTYPAEQRELIILDDGGQYGDLRGDGWQIVSFPRRFASLGEKRNACVSLAHPRSEIIVVADDDEIYLPHWLECHANAFERGAAWSFASSIFWSEENRIVRKWHYENESWIMHSAHAYLKTLFWEVQGYPHIAWTEDHYFFEKLRGRNIRHENALNGVEMPYMICRRNLGQEHVHTTMMNLEQYQTVFSMPLPKASLEIGWKKDYLGEARAFHETQSNSPRFPYTSKENNLLKSKEQS